MPRATIHEDNNYSTSSSFGTDLDILSYNINNVAVYNMIKRQRISHAIFSTGAHIMLLQETNPQWEEVLRKKELYQYTYFHHPGEGERAAGGLAILSKFPLEDVRVVDFLKDFPGSVFPALICCVKFPV